MAIPSDMPQGETPDVVTGAGRLTVDLSALRRNYRRLVQAAQGAAVAGIVKADAYGLGAVPVAQTLVREGCTSFFVAQLGEAIALREALGGSAEILVLNGLQPGAEELAYRAGVTPVLNALHQIAAWRRLAHRHGQRLPAVIQLDSGMSRLGLPPEDAAWLAAQSDGLDGLELTLVMSHLACADMPDHPANDAQLNTFREIAGRFPPARRSLANSGGLFLGPDYRFDLVRPGVALYGGAPHPGADVAIGVGNPMEAVVTVEAPVTQLRTVPAGAGIGYGFTRRAERPMRLATIPVGYADGWHRSQSNCGAALWQGRRLDFVGRVSMDSIILDATHAPDLQPGDMVELIGPGRSLDAVAQDAGTISYEILTSLGSRFQRRFVDPQGARP